MATAQCLSNLAERFPAPELQVRARIAGVCRKVLEKAQSAHAASSHNLSGCFGAAVGLQAMGMQLVRMMLIPVLPTVMRTLLPCINRVLFFSPVSAVCLWHCVSSLLQEYTKRAGNGYHGDAVVPFECVWMFLNL